MCKMIISHAHVVLALLTFSMQVTGEDNAQAQTNVSSDSAVLNKESHSVTGTGPDSAIGRVTSGGGGDGSGPHEGGMELTPWWPLVMSAGEAVSVDCGVYRGSDPSSEPNLVWVDPSGVDLCKKNDPRISCILRDKNHESDSLPGAYRVLVLYITNLTTSDGGSYLCNSSRKVNQSINITTKTISISILSPDTLCTFEGEDMCGWRDLADGNTSTLEWRRHDGADKSSLNRAKGLRYDHTYGASKHSGHMVDIDIARDRPVLGATARLQSPRLTHHSHTRCLHFWYIYYGRDLEHLRVVKQKLKKPKNRQATAEDIEEEAEENEETLLYLNSSLVDHVWHGEWDLATLEIPAQTDDYVVTFEAMTHKTRYKSGSIAIDDVRFFNSTCAQLDKNHIWPDRRLKVRLLDGRNEYEGRVEILHDGMWGSVCSTQFGDKEAKVICNMLGYKSEGAEGKRKSIFGQAAEDVIIWLQKLGCGGNEEDLGSCIAKNETWGGTERCSHQADASVICGDTNVLPTVMETTTTTTADVTTQIVTTQETHLDTTLPPVPLTNQSTSTSTTKPTTEATPPAMTSSTPTPTTPRKTTTTSSPKVTETPLKVITTQPEVTEETLVETTLGGSTENDSSAGTGWTEEPVQTKHQRRNTGAAVGISLTVLILTAAAGVWVYRRRKNRRKSKYIVFSNPKYSREHLPANDISLDSPLTSGSSILA